MNSRRRPKDLLVELTRLSGVNAATLIGVDGFIIESISNNDIDLEALGAVVSTAFGSSQVMGNEMLLGGLAQTIFEYGTGKILFAACGPEAILALVTNNNAVIGNLRHNMMKIMGELAKII